MFRRNKKSEGEEAEKLEKGKRVATTHQIMRDTRSTFQVIFFEIHRNTGVVNVSFHSITTMLKSDENHGTL